MKTHNLNPQKDNSNKFFTKNDCVLDIAIVLLAIIVIFSSNSCKRTVYKDYDPTYSEISIRIDTAVFFSSGEIEKMF